VHEPKETDCGGADAMHSRLRSGLGSARGGSSARLSQGVAVGGLGRPGTTTRVHGGSAQITRLAMALEAAQRDAGRRKVEQGAAEREAISARAELAEAKQKLQRQGRQLTKAHAQLAAVHGQLQEAGIAIEGPPVTGGVESTKVRLHDFCAVFVTCGRQRRFAIMCRGLLYAIAWRACCRHHICALMTCTGSVAQPALHMGSCRQLRSPSGVLNQLGP
jgi:hypothetical protein